MPHKRPKKRREEKAAYKNTQRLRAEDIEQDNDGEAIIGADRLAIYC